ncbi:hypothetical protein CNC00325 [Cryptococcus deneoformans JEC21]|uniref:Uncharacterized protein n=1 Tax=Cryptococcus deneoformans (strain JEC21 / ATCC MYA-565) TaxID=214684 RepID=A0A0S2LI99_CRYD1|nr:hypothetical protein CNC00325 [Cryptococcus neoformans var. neoformans JEC21]ALO60436.1 hypothetical protein CNC00325 [Cryptococcus neoformans var. neoformans JEC21]
MQRTKLRTMPSLDSGYFEHSPPSSSSPPPTDEEKMSVPTLAGEALDLLASQDMMALGDFIAELREDYDLRTAVVDEVLEHMTTHGWVQLWKRKGTEEAWISVTED